MASFLRSTKKKDEKEEGRPETNTRSTSLTHFEPRRSRSTSSSLSQGSLLSSITTSSSTSSSSSSKKKLAATTPVYLPIKTLQDQLDLFMPLHNQMARTIQSNELSISDGNSFAEKLREYAEKQQNTKTEMVLKKVSEWETKVGSLRTELTNVMNVNLCDPLHENYIKLKKQSKCYDKAKAAFEAADLRLKQYNSKGAKLNLVRHVELEQEVDQRSRELLQSVQEISLLKEEFDKLCMDKMLGYLESWEQFFNVGHRLIRDLLPFIEKSRIETAQFGKDLETYQKVKLRDLNPLFKPSGSSAVSVGTGGNACQEACTPQIGVVDDDYLFAIKDSAIFGYNNTPNNLSPPSASPLSLSPSALSPTASPILYLSPASSPRQLSPEEIQVISPSSSSSSSTSTATTTTQPISIESQNQPSSPSPSSPPAIHSSFSPILSTSPESRDKEKDTATPPSGTGGRGSVIRLSDWDSGGSTAALVKSQKRLSVRYYRPTLSGSPVLSNSPIPPVRKIFSDEEDDDHDLDDGPWEMRHSTSSLFGDIPNVFDIRKVTRVGKGRSMTITVNVEVNNFVLKRKTSGKESIRSSTSLLQIIKSRKRDRRVRMIWFLPSGSEENKGNDVFEECYFLASKLQRQRFFEVASWAPIVGAMNEVQGKRVFLTTEELSVFVGSWNVGFTSKVPDSLHSFIPKIGRPNDIIVVGLQDCGTDAWFDTVQLHLGTSYIKLATKTAGHLRMAIFIQRKHFHKISYYQAVASTKAIVLSLMFHETSLCFMNCRFPIQDSKDQRNRIWRSIVRDCPLKNNYFDITHQYHHQFVFGDFNYRLEGNKDTISDLIAKKDWKGLSAYDELSKERKAGHCFAGYEEAPLYQPPSYPFLPGTRNYTNEPAWSDRIMWKSQPGLTENIASISYTVNDEETTFEHAPVNSTFTVNTILPNMPHQTVPCHINISRLYLSAKLTNNAKTANFIVEFCNPDFVDKTISCSSLSQVIVDPISSQHIILGNKDDVVVVVPFTTNKQYLINQQLYVVVLSSEGGGTQEFAQGILSLREVCTFEKTVKFVTNLYKNNKPVGTLCGKISLTYNQLTSNPSGGCTWLKEGETNLESLKRILKNPGARRVFEDYMKAQMAEENVVFCVAVQARKQLEEKEKREAEAHSIFKKFLSGKGMYEINIESDLKKELTDSLEADPSDPCLFDSVEFHILRELSENSLRRFLQTEQGTCLEVTHALFYE